MYNFPHWLAHRLGILNQPHTHVYCSRCKTRNDGRGVFLGYKCGGYLLIPQSKGKNRVVWQTIQEGGVCCDEGHYTTLEDGTFKTIDSEAENVRVG